MDILEKIRELEQKIIEVETDPEEVDFMIDFIEDNFDKFRYYFNAVYEHVRGGEVAKLRLDSGRYSTQEYQDFVMDKDTSRKIAHDSAMDACSIINRQCDAYGVAHICPDVIVENERQMNRGEVADFAGEFVYKVFQEGKHNVTLEQELSNKNLIYGDRTKMDAAYSIAREYGDNPPEAYKKQNVIDKIRSREQNEAINLSEAKNKVKEIDKELERRKRVSSVIKSKICQSPTRSGNIKSHIQKM